MLERERSNALRVARSSYQVQHGVDLLLLKQWRDSGLLPELRCLLPLSNATLPMWFAALRNGSS